MPFKNLLLSICCVCYLLLPAKAQPTLAGQDAQLLAYNIGFGAVTSGVGALINKRPHERWHKALLRGASQGALGGGMLYAGKKSVYLMARKQTGNMGYAWPAAIFHAAGYSIIQNAAMSAPFMQNWSYELGPVRFDYAFHKPHPLRARFLPEVIPAWIFATQVGGRFDAKTSLQTGQIVFVHTGLIDNNGQAAEGVSWGRSIIYADFLYTKGHVMAHELVHNFQYSEYQVINLYTTPLTDKIKNKTMHRIFNNYIYADVPWALFAYQLYGHYDNAHHFRNWYEFEAEHFSTNNWVDRY